MAVVVYECDTCKRQAHRPQNQRGLDTVGRCIITDGCRGKLNQTQIKPSHAVGHSTPPVLGLKDWSPRRILHTHNQELARQRWQIDHNLNGLPIVNVYTYANNGKLLEVQPEKVEYINNNTVAISFRTITSGKAQMIMRSSVTDQQISTLRPLTDVALYDSERFVMSQAFPLTNGPDSFGELTIASRIRTAITSGFDPYEEIIIQPYYMSPSTLQVLPINQALVFKAVNNLPVDASSSPWAGATKAVIQGGQYLLRSTNIHGAGGTLNTKGVPEGAPIFFKVQIKNAEGQLIDRPIVKGELIGLVATAPFLTVDRIHNQYVDLSVISQPNAPKQIVYSNLNWMINPSLLTKTYPDIITL